MSTQTTQSKGQLLFSGFLLAVFVFAIASTFTFPDRARFAPLVVSIPGLLITGYWLLRQIISAKKQRTGAAGNAQNTTENTAVSIDRQTQWSKELNPLLWVGGLVLLVWIIGFLVAIPLYLFLYMRVRSKEKLWFSIVFSLISWGVLYLMFSVVLHSPLYEGLIQESFF